MGHIAPRSLCSEVDLESGERVGSIEDSSRSPISGVKIQARSLFSKVYSQFVEDSEGRVSWSGNVLNAREVSVENAKVVISMNPEGKENKGVEEKKTMTEGKNKKGSNKKASNKKPPRPPRSPSLDTADHKLIRELAELARLKRARMERMKASKKMKAAKTSSSNGNVLAMLFTIIFFLVIIFQGMLSGGSHINNHGSPLPTGATEASLISVQYFGNPVASDPNGPNSGSPNLVEQVSGSDPQEQPRRFTE